MMKRTVIAALALGFMPALCAARAGRPWVPFGPPPGGVSTLALDAGGNIYASTEQGGVYKSADQGASWAFSGSGMGTESVRALAADASGTQLVAITGSGVFSSLDSAHSWVLLARAEILDVASATADVLALANGAPTWFLGRQRQLFRSLDAGRSWSKVLVTDADIASILVDPHDPTSVFVGTTQSFPNQLLHSDDGGTTWAPVTNVEPLPSNPQSSPFVFGVGDLVAVPTRPGTLFVVAGGALFRSLDGGGSWRWLPGVSAPGGPQLFVESVAAGPGRRGEIFLLYEVRGPAGRQRFGALVSSDLGTTWSRLDRQGLAEGLHLQVQPGTGDLVALQADRVAIGQEHGQDWTTSRLGGEFCGGLSGIARIVRSTDPALVVTLVGSRLYRSANGGASFSAVSPDTENGGGCVEFTDVALDAASGTWFGLSTRDLYQSSDGTNWSVVSTTGFDNFDPPLYNLVALGNDQLLVGTCGIARSADGGRTWVETLACEAHPEFAQMVRRLIPDPSDPNRVAALVVEVREEGFPTATYFTELSADGGRSWKRVNVLLDALAFDPVRPQRLDALRGDTFLRSVDGGQTWKQLSSFGVPDPDPSIYFGSQADLAVEASSPLTVDVARWDGVWRSRDGGLTFTPLNAGLETAVLPLSRITAAEPPGRLWVSGQGVFTGLFP
jgi:photosystem II stability/assembly factor-like uncharacterized protein